MRKNIKITFRVTEDELENIRTKAEKSNMKMSMFLRTVALEGEVKVYDMKAIVGCC